MKFVLVGVGKIAKKSVLPAILNSGKTTLVACVDRKIEKQEEVRAKYGVPLVTSLQEAISSFEFDAVYISTPIGLHTTTILEAAAAKKHILCEKSIVASLHEAEEAVAACEKNGVALFEGFMYQFHEQHKVVQSIIAAGKIGEPFRFEARFGFPPIDQNDFRYSKQMGGGSLLDAGAYTVHAARHFFGKEHVSINSNMFYGPHEVDMRGHVLMDFGAGKVADLSFGFDNYYQNRYSVWGTKGCLTLSRAFAVPPDFSSTLVVEAEGKVESISMPTDDHFIKELQLFAQWANNEQHRVSWYQEILAQSRTLNAIRGQLL
ncbi:MAG: Gfo/Idh/MocA family protein [Chitinophagaceae bacterium]|jgi:NDP-hexose-3-ketoreductase